MKSSRGNRMRVIDPRGQSKTQNRAARKLRAAAAAANSSVRYAAGYATRQKCVSRSHVSNVGEEGNEAQRRRRWLFPNVGMEWKKGVG